MMLTTRHCIKSLALCLLTVGFAPSTFASDTSQEPEMVIEPLDDADTSAFTLDALQPPPVAVAPQPRRVVLDEYTEAKIRKGRRLARRGAGVFFAGLAVDLGVSLPLTMAGVINEEPALLIGGLVAGMVSNGLKIGGSIQCGVGGSTALKAAVEAGVLDRRAAHWQLYKAGWVFVGIANMMNGAVAMSGEEDLPPAVTATATSFIVVGNALWAASCGSALRVSREAGQKGGITLRTLQPRLSFDGSSGIDAVFAF